MASTSPGEWRLQATFMAKLRGFGISVQHQAIRQKKARIMQGFSYKCCCLGEKKVFFFFFLFIRTNSEMSVAPAKLYSSISINLDGNFLAG